MTPEEEREEKYPTPEVGSLWMENGRIGSDASIYLVVSHFVRTSEKGGNGIKALHLLGPHRLMAVPYLYRSWHDNMVKVSD